MQTPPLLILLGWSAQTKMFPSISSRLSSVEESRYVSDKHIKSSLYIEIYAFICVSFEKLWADKLSRFSRQTEREYFLSFFCPAFDSISPWQSKRTKKYIRVIREVYTL